MLPKAPSMLIEYLRKSRKTALYSEARFLHATNARILSTNYKALLQNSTTSNISISLTTHKDRIYYLHYVLDSLFFQILRPKCVDLYVTRGEYTKLPDFFNQFYPWLQVHECKNYGAFKKFIPKLKSAQKNELIVSLDDDYIYPPHLISSLYNLKCQNPESITVYCGHSEPAGMSGGTGILWDTNIINEEKLPFFFDEAIFFDAIGKNMDDLFISVAFQEAGINVSPVHKSSQVLNLLRSEFIALPSELLHAISGAPSSNNISKKEQDALTIKAREIIKKALNKA